METAKRLRDAPAFYVPMNLDWRGRGYVCTLPVSFDGSCSGIQHLAGMTRRARLTGEF